MQATCRKVTGETIPCASRLPPTTVAILSCKVGYKRPERVVRDAITCQQDGTWDSHVYKCDQVCGTVSDGMGLVIGGTTTNIAKVPWHAAIYQNRGDNEMEQICGGTIINPTAIVTAAHCFWNAQFQRMNGPELYAVAVGKTIRDFSVDEGSVQTFNVTKIDTYEQYKDYNGLYAADIAVIILSRPIIFYSHIKPICIEYNRDNNERYIAAGIKGRVAGWGLTSARGQASPMLKIIDLPTVDYNTCMDVMPDDFKTFVTNDKFCAGFTTGQSVCTGDSGGGLVIERKFADNTSAYYLRGIVSTGPTLLGSSCDNKRYTAFTDVQINIIFLYPYISYL